MNRKSVLRLVASVFAIACFLLFGHKYLGQLNLILNAHWTGIILMITVHLLTLWWQAKTIKWGLEPFRQISERVSFSLFVISSYANLLLPRSGLGTTGVYLNRKHRVSVVDYSSVVLFNGVLFVIACSLVGSFLMALGWFNGGTTAFWLSTFLFCMLAAGLGALLIRWRLPRWYRGPGLQLLDRLDHAKTKLIRSDRLLPLLLTHFGLLLLRAFRLYLAFWAMGIEASLPAVLMMSVLGDLAFVIAVTPGALGFREAAIAIVAGSVGASASTAISVAVLDRLVFSLTVFVTAQIVIAFAISSRRLGHLANGGSLDKAG